jgi:hypothetical protein
MARWKIVRIISVVVLLALLLGAPAYFLWKNGNSPAEPHVSPLQMTQFAQFKIALTVVGDLNQRVSDSTANFSMSNEQAGLLFWQAACVSDAAARQLPACFSKTLQSISRAELDFAESRFNGAAPALRDSFIALTKFRADSIGRETGASIGEGYASGRRPGKIALPAAGPGKTRPYSRQKGLQYLRLSRIMVASLMARASDSAEKGHHAQAGMLFWQAAIVANVMQHEMVEIGLHVPEAAFTRSVIDLARHQFSPDYSRTGAGLRGWRS